MGPEELVVTALWCGAAAYMLRQAFAPNTSCSSSCAPTEHSDSTQTTAVLGDSLQRALTRARQPSSGRPAATIRLNAEKNEKILNS